MASTRKGTEQESPGSGLERQRPGSWVLRGDLFAPEASNMWSLYRRSGAVLALLTCLALATLWGWAGGWVVGGVAAMAAVDAEMRRRGAMPRSLVQSVLVDLTLIGVAVTLIDLDPAGIGAAYVYTMSIALLLLPGRQAILTCVYSSLWAALALWTGAVFSLPSGVERGVVTGIAYVLFTVLLLVMIAVLSRSLSKSRRFAGQRLKGEGALVVAAQNLLAEAGDDAMTEALQAIREATGARAAFVAENSGGRGQGPAAVVTQVMGGPDSVAGPTSMKWTLPYMQHREVARQLASGEAIRLDDVLGAVMGSEPGSVVAVAVPVSVDGEWAGFLGIAHDLGDGPAPEPDLHVLTTIAAMMGAFFHRREAYRQLQQTVQSKDQFLASVSHEIRTPLTSVLGFASLLHDEGSHVNSQDGQELIDLIQHQAQEVSDLVEDLLVAARADIDAVSVVQEPVVLSEEIERVLAARLRNGTDDIHVATNVGHQALADPTRVRQIVRNLLTNAIRYGGDQITITTHRAGPEMILVFSDNGEGISPEYRRRIFDPYHRGKPGLAKPDSIGLGLAVSKQLARLMDGDLTLRSDLGPATFQLTLPAAPRTPEADADLVEREVSEVAAAT